MPIDKCKRVRFPDYIEGEASNNTSSGSGNVEEERQLATVVCIIPSREEYEKEEMDAMFFTRQDYVLSRSQAKVISKESERYGFSKNLEKSWAEKSNEIQVKLNQWAANGHARRGLERWAHSEHGETRQQDQFQAIMTVLRAQDDMLAKKRVIDMEKLRKVSHKSTKLARHYARMMGKADAFAVAEQIRTEDPNALEGMSSKSLMNEYAEGISIAPSVTTTATAESYSADFTNVSAMYDTSGFSPQVDEDGLVSDFPPAVDEVSEGTPDSRFKLRQRLGFGRKNREKNDDARVSRVA